jgi:hypothetical protein
MTTFEPVGIVQPVAAAFEDVGLVTRSVLGSNRGPSVVVAAAVFARGAAVDTAAADELDVDVLLETDGLLSSPN